MPAGTSSNALRVRLAVLLKQRYVEHTGDDADWSRADALFDEAVRLVDEDNELGRKMIVDAGPPATMAATTSHCDLRTTSP